MILLILALFIQTPLGFSSLGTSSVSGVGTVSGVGDYGDFSVSVSRFDYMLGAGDIVVITVEGGCSPFMIQSGLLPVYTCTVSADGMISVSGVGQIYIAGLCLDEAEDVLNWTAKRYYPSIILGLQLLEPRRLRVSIQGMVYAPGSYALYSTHRVSDLVEVAGMLSPYASRIGMMLVNEDSIEVNLLINPETREAFSDPFLREGTRVIFSICTDPVFVVRLEAEFTEIETWDLISPGTLYSFIDNMGGIESNVDLPRSTIRRNNEVLSLWSDSAGIVDMDLFPGDTLVFARHRTDIVVTGAVNEPSRIPYHPAISVLDYVALAGGTTVDGSINGAKIFRSGTLYMKGRDALEVIPCPGDVIEIPFSWFERNKSLISISVSVIGLFVTISYLF